MASISEKEKWLPGRLSICRIHSSESGETIMILLQDSLSRVQFVEVEMSLEDFTRAVTGSGYIPMKFNTRKLENVGLKKENKTELIPFDKQTVLTLKEDAVIIMIC
jgi:hypothetical protein